MLLHALGWTAMSCYCACVWKGYTPVRNNQPHAAPCTGVDGNVLLLCLNQAAEERYVRVLPPVGQRVKVSFYSAAADDLAIHHGVLRSLLSAAGKPR